jgi:peptidoglycan/xylan/chitin deacetylase (PgdA/CDA1 family)
LDAIVETARCYGTAPTIFVPAVVARRHRRLMAQLAGKGAELGLHGYVHNDYRLLPADDQLRQTRRGLAVFAGEALPCSGTRNPYLGWTPDSTAIYERLGLAYDSNEAVAHDVVPVETLTPLARAGYEKSLMLFQAIAPSACALRPHFEGRLVRVPVSLPDDEILFDRLRITEPAAIGAIWSAAFDRVYALGGIFVLNLHPERGVLCRDALATLLAHAEQQPLPVWAAPLREVAAWWEERSRFRLRVARADGERDAWCVTATCSPRATLLARNAATAGDAASPWHGVIRRLRTHAVVIHAQRMPCVGLSDRTPQAIDAFLYAQGYPVVRGTWAEEGRCGLRLDLPEGLGTTRGAQLERGAAIVRAVEGSEGPLVYFGAWPDGAGAAISISGDLDSVTIQDFFLRILEVR